MLGKVQKLIIIGSGPAGFTAAIYAARAGLAPLVLEGPQPGGQLTITTEVENFPGFEEGIMGPELMEKLRKQAKRFGAETIFKSVSEVDLSKMPFRIRADGDEYLTRTIIIATGASAKFLSIPGEKEYMGYGVSACATCDGFFFRGQHVAVVGGGDTAMEEALYLTKHAEKVTIIHRRDALRASKIMAEKAMNNPKIQFMWNTVVIEVLGTEDSGGKKMTGLKIKNVSSGEVAIFKCDGLFLAIGHEPNTKMFKGILDLDENGYIITKPKSTATSIPGVFAAGDVADPRYRQAVTAAGTGCMAAIDVEKYLLEIGEH